MNSLEIRQARETIINYLNGLKMPMEVKRLMVEEIHSQICAVAEQEIAAQIKERESLKEKEESTEKEEVKPDE